MITVTPEELADLQALEVDAEKLADAELAERFESAPGWIRALAVDAVNLGAKAMLDKINAQIQVKPP
jgi:hypothetical protein